MWVGFLGVRFGVGGGEVVKLRPPSKTLLNYAPDFKFGA